MTDDIFDAVNAAIARAERCPTTEQRAEYLEEIRVVMVIHMRKVCDLIERPTTLNQEVTK